MIGAKLEGEGLHFTPLYDNEQDPQTAVFLSAPNFFSSTDRGPWDGMVLIEHEGHPVRTQPAASTKGKPVWTQDKLSFYGDKDVVARMKDALGY